MEIYKHVIEDLTARMKDYRQKATDSFMERSNRHFRHYQSMAAGIDVAIEVIRQAYEEHPTEE